MSKPDGGQACNFIESFGLDGAEFKQSVIDFFPDIVYACDLDNRKLIYTTEKITSVLGFTLLDLKEWDYDLMRLVYKDDAENVLKELEKYTTLQNDAIHSYQCRFNRKSEGWLTVKVTGKVIKRNSDGRPSSLLFIAQDVSNQVVAAEERRAIGELKSSVSNLEEFTQIASHDIQEPLRRIATFSERMKAKFASDLNGEAMGYLDRIMRTSRNAHLLIDGLLDFLQLDHKHLHFVTTDLNVLLGEVKDDLELRTEELEATITWGNLPRLEVIPQQIKQLFVNLISNALKFRKPERSIVVSLDARKLTAEDVRNYQLKHGLDYYEITVRDNGVGFNTAATENMFKMFQRFHNKSAYPGAGIGLAICRKIVDKHRGLIMARSVPGEGATFTVVLPVNQIKRHEPN
jgi:signal transduction histidine kinase